MTFTNNTIAVAGDYGIYCDNSSSSIIQNNSIDGSYSQGAIWINFVILVTIHYQNYRKFG